MALAAQRSADAANFGIQSHERVCAERYDNIKNQLSGIPRLFGLTESNKTEMTNAIDALRKWVYIGIGICTGVPVIIQIILIFVHPSK